MGWLSAGLGLLGNIFSARSAESGASAANAANAAEAQKNRDFQLMMSSTAHQREVEDLRKAGLNPILSAMGGSGAPMGSGSMASFDNTKAISSNILANSAKMVSEMMLNRELVKTERTKQAVNAAQVGVNNATALATAVNAAANTANARANTQNAQSRSLQASGYLGIPGFANIPIGSLGSFLNESAARSNVGLNSAKSAMKLAGLWGFYPGFLSGALRKKAA